MKKRLGFLFIGIFILCGSVFAWYESGSWTESRCNICGKYIYTWSEGRIYPYMPTIDIADGGSLPPGEASATLSSEIPVCNDCLNKYIHTFHTLTDKWVLQKKAENADLWEKYGEEHRKKMVEEKSIELKKLYEELLELSKTAEIDFTGSATNRNH